MTIRLATRGDDAGSFRSANRAIRAAFEDGILRNASVMAPAPELEHAAEELAGLDGLCIGVHATITSEWDAPRWGPILDPDAVPTLVRDDGTFPRRPDAVRDADPEEVAAEVRAQIDAVGEAGFDPDYLDSHHGVERFEGLGAALGELRERDGLLDGTAPPPLPAIQDGIEGLGSGPEDLLARLEAADPGTYLVVGHPGDDDEELRAVTRPGKARGEVATERDAQRRMFTDGSVRAYCAEHGVEPIRFTDRRNE